MSSSASSNSTEIITNVVFGITATAISIVTVWQGHRVWKMWHEYAHGQDDVAPDIELGLQSFRPTPTSLEGPEGEDLIASSAPAVNQVGEVSVSVQRPELQSTLPTTVDAETSLSPALVHGAQIECNEYPRVHTDRAQPALTDMESREFRPAANDHL